MPIITQKFKEAYKKLNPEQKEAVDAIEGPVMVIAGPGTGKTEVLTLRIANIILKTDTPPESILALTFTESGAQSMKKRLIELIGTDGYEVYITTFHGFSNFIIQNYPEFFPEIIGSLNISEADQIKILREIIEKNSLEYLKPKNNIYFYIPEIKKVIEDLKRENIDPQKLQKILEEEEENFYKKEDLFNKDGKIRSKYIEGKRNLEKNKELLFVYEKYEQTLHKKKYYDYNDMILKVAKVLGENEDLLSILQEKYQYILVDEHQDTNKAQNKILELLAGFYPNPNLFVVGDAKQAIFRFQGASLENFLYFKKIYKGVKLVTLQKNYRSSQTILDAAFELIGRKDKRLIAKNTSKSSLIKVCTFEKGDYESFFIAQKIKEFIKSGVKAENIAIIFRENKDAYPIASFLEKLNIDFHIDADENILNDNYINRLKIILDAVKNFGDDEYFLKALQVNFLEIPEIDIYKFIVLANKIKKESKNKNAFYDVAKNRDLMEKNGIENAELIFNFYKKMNFWKSEAVRENPLNVLEDIVRESGLLNKILKDPNGQNRLQKLRAFYNHLRSLVETHKDFLLEDFVEYLNLLETHNIKIKSIAQLPPPGKVRLLTAHKAKGQEFEIVFIINAVDGKWGSKRKSTHIKLPSKIYSLLENENHHELEEEDEELNIFYVALTRAKKEVFITYSKTDDSGNIRQPSKFILRIKPELLEYLDTKKEEEKFDLQLPVIFNKTKKLLPSLEEKEYLNQLFEEQGLSVTALNNFLECPWKYFYRNLLRIPEAPETSLIYGNAIHYALKKFFEELKKDPHTNINKEYLIKMFILGLSHEPIDEINFEDLLKRGKKALSGYYQKYHQEWKTNVLVEKNIEGIVFEGIKLNGKIDKIEILDLANNVNVVDYKTGEPKSLNAIYGLTKNNDGSYFRQIVFYKILLDNYQNGKYKMKYGTIDFVEPNKNGVYKKYTFEVKEEDEKKVKEEIKTTAQKIRNLEFWNEFCENKNCYYCQLRKLTLQKENVL